ncbi:MAG: Crp/Fnr family transcriptional regulator [Bacteroidota bacterium]|nr:Crp/Fnr family transcriptional regulator [Bacteroidota bacterium]
MQELVIYLQQFNGLSPTDLEQIRSKAVPLTLGKGDYLPRRNPEANADAPGDELVFVCTGVLRAVHVDSQGVEVTEYFIDEGHFVPGTDGSSRRHASPALQQALMKTELLVLSTIAVRELSASIPAWDLLLSRIKTRMDEYRIAGMRPAQAGDATACYKEFLEKFPQIAARIPLSYLASYLGITQQSFSRIRQKLAKNAYRPAR